MCVWHLELQGHHLCVRPSWGPEYGVVCRPHPSIGPNSWPASANVRGWNLEGGCKLKPVPRWLTYSGDTPCVGERKRDQNVIVSMEKDEDIRKSILSCTRKNFSA